VEEAVPRPKAIERYPESYFDLFERAYAAPIVIPTGSPSAAANLRSELYTFRRVLRNSVLEGGIRRQVALMADDLQFRVKDKELIVERRPLARGRLVERILDTQEATHESTNELSAASG
jgi:hypothetical protein